jgi:hypothetical protein
MQVTYIFVFKSLDIRVLNVVPASLSKCLSCISSVLGLCYEILVNTKNADFHSEVDRK